MHNVTCMAQGLATWTVDTRLDARLLDTEQLFAMLCVVIQSQVKLPLALISSSGLDISCNNCNFIFCLFVEHVT